MGHCAQRGGTAAMMRIEEDDDGEDNPISEQNIAEVVIDVDDSNTSDDEEKYLGAIISFVDKVMIVAEQTYDDEAKGKDDGDDIVTLSTTSTSSSSALGGHTISSFRRGRGDGAYTFRGDGGGGPSTLGGAGGGSKSGTDKGHSDRVDQNLSLEASTCLMIEQLRVERPELHAFLCSMRFAKSKANLSTTVALNAVGKLCHPCVTKSTHGQFDLLVFIVLRLIGYSAGSISKGLGLSPTTSSITMTASAASEAEKTLQVVLASTRNSVRSEVGKKWNAYPPCPLPSSPFYSVRLVIEKELSKYLKPWSDGEGGRPQSHLPTSFKESYEVTKIVRPLWDELQSAFPVWRREPWTEELAAEAFKVWGKSTQAVFRLRRHSSAAFFFPESNPLKQYTKEVTDALRLLLDYRYNKSSEVKKFATPDELNVIISNILKDKPLREGDRLTVNHMREAYQYWGPTGDGTAIARTKAGNESRMITQLQDDIRRLLKKSRDSVAFSKVLTKDEETQLQAATLQALNDSNKSEKVVKLSDDLSKTVVEWANGRDGRLFLAAQLNRKA